MSWAWVLGFVYYRNRNAWWANALVLAGIPFVTHYAANPNSAETFAILAAILIGGRFLGRIPAMAGRLMRWLGDMSYPMYIVQGQVFLMIYMVSHSRSIFAYIAVLLLVSAFILHCFDNPVKGWLKRRAALSAVNDGACMPDGALAPLEASR